MSNSRRFRAAILPACICTIVMPFAHAGSVTLPHSFTANTPAVAQQVNENFGAVATGVNDNATDIAALQSAISTLQAAVAAQAATITSLQTTVSDQAATITSLQSDLATVQDNSVLQLDGALALVTDPATYRPTARFTGVNVQIVNGEGGTNSINGLGNLIVGYNEDTNNYYKFCSKGTDDDNQPITDQTTCENDGGTWAANQRSGSHNLVLGNQNFYSQYGGLVAGYGSLINGVYASVSGGYGNTASGDYASVSGGAINTASSNYASVSGGVYNTASEGFSSVSGGESNTASGTAASVSGGQSLDATGSHGWIGGTYSSGN